MEKRRKSQQEKEKNDKTKHLGKEGQPEDKVEKVRGEQSRKSPADADTGDERTENAALSEGLGGPGPPRGQRGAAGGSGAHSSAGRNQEPRPPFGKAATAGRLAGRPASRGAGGSRETRTWKGVRPGGCGGDRASGRQYLVVTANWMFSGKERMSRRERMSLSRTAEMAVL